MQEHSTEGHPFLSIITGLYNSEPYLAHYVAMLQEQTFTDWEAILVDDGSTDGTCAKVEELIAKDSRFRLVRKQPEGFPSRSRAVGLSLARAPYVAFVDHDDFWAPQKLECQVEALKRYPKPAILHTDRIVWQDREPPQVKYHYSGSMDQLPIRVQRPEDVIYQGLQIIFSSFLGPKEWVESVGFHPDMKGVDDFYLFVRLAQLGPIIRVDLPLTYYYAHGQNLSHSRNIFVEGFYKVYEALCLDPVPEHVKRSIHAQACRTEAVSLFATNRKEALRLLLKSLRLYFIPSTLNRLLFLIMTWWIPLSQQEKLFRWVKLVKFKIPTVKDLGLLVRGKQKSYPSREGLH